MVDRELILRRLERLAEYQAILEKLSRYTRQDFVSEPERYGSAERFPQLSIELIDDLGNHIVSDEGLGAVAKTTDAPALLAEQGYIDAELADRWARLVGFRNILVHEYTEIDRNLVHQYLTERLGDFQTLRQVFARLL